MRLLAIITFLLFHSVSYGQDMPVTKIDLQVWAKINLNVKQFRNGDPIRYVASNDEWINCHAEGIPAYCYYNNDARNGNAYGAIYNWFAMADSRGLAPEGFRVANDIDWAILYNFLKRGINNYQDQGVSAIKLKSTYSWSEGGNGEDQYGMAILPGGCRLLNGTFDGIGNSVGLWSRDTITYYGYSKSNAYSSYNTYFQANMNDMLFKKENKRTGFYVRCIYGIEPLIINNIEPNLTEYEIYQKKLNENLMQDKTNGRNSKEKKKKNGN